MSSGKTFKASSTPSLALLLNPLAGFIWIRAFPNAKARDKAIDAYYGSPEWAKIVDEIRPLIKRREVRVMKSLPYSTLK